MIHSVHNRVTGETLAIELEIGTTWWLRDKSGLVIEAEREHLPPERWQLLRDSGDDSLQAPPCRPSHAHTQQAHV